jgi:hypothetical protein
MTDTALGRIIAALEACNYTVTTTGHRTKAQCPAHEDSTPSLSITAIPGRVLIHCHAGCRTEDVLDSLGLEFSDLFDEKSVRYDYTDVTGGTVLRSVYRTPSKDFRQSIADKSTVPLYRLPEVVKAIADGQTVYLVEGEQDADTLETLGVVATTAPMGAGNFGQVDATPLHGGNIVAIVDRDQKGDDWAKAVHKALDGHALSLTFVEAKEGKDAADHIAAEHGLGDFQPREVKAAEPGRRLVLTPLDTIKPKRVYWLMSDRIPAGKLSLIAGREGIGKSTLSNHLIAAITRGTLPGSAYGKPRRVIISASEDDLAETIVPRLIAAGADMSMVAHIDAFDAEGSAGLRLPVDNKRLVDLVREADAAMVVLDPLMSAIDGKIDTHKDNDTRQALVPLASLAARTGAAVIGLAHVNKGTSKDALTQVMASKAFTAVPRAVLHVMVDPDDETGRIRLVGQSKNNLGRLDLPTLTFQIETASVDTDEGPADVGRLVWGANSNRSIHDVLRDDEHGPDDRTATQDAADWLEDYLTLNPDSGSGVVKTDGRKAGHSESAISRARRKLRIVSSSGGYPRTTTWALPVKSPSGDSATTDATDTTDTTESLSGRHLSYITNLNTNQPDTLDPQLCQSRQSRQSDHVSRRDTTEELHADTTDCAHGVENGHLPAEWRGGLLTCPHCQSAAITNNTDLPARPRQ